LCDGTDCQSAAVGSRNETVDVSQWRRPSGLHRRLRALEIHRVTHFCKRHRDAAALSLSRIGYTRLTPRHQRRVWLLISTCRDRFHIHTTQGVVSNERRKGNQRWLCRQDARMGVYGPTAHGFKFKCGRCFESRSSLAEGIAA
jgi:hypothetical protein